MGQTLQEGATTLSLAIDHIVLHHPDETPLFIVRQVQKGSRVHAYAGRTPIAVAYVCVHHAEETCAYIMQRRKREKCTVRNEQSARSRENTAVLSAAAMNGRGSDFIPICIINNCRQTDCAPTPTRWRHATTTPMSAHTLPSRTGTVGRATFCGTTAGKSRRRRRGVEIFPFGKKTHHDRPTDRPMVKGLEVVGLRRHRHAAAVSFKGRVTFRFDWFRRHFLKCLDIVTARRSAANRFVSFFVSFFARLLVFCKTVSAMDTVVRIWFFAQYPVLMSIGIH